MGQTDHVGIGSRGEGVLMKFTSAFLYFPRFQTLTFILSPPTRGIDVLRSYLHGIILYQILQFAGCFPAWFLLCRPTACSFGSFPPYVVNKACYFKSGLVCRAVVWDLCRERIVVKESQVMSGRSIQSKP
jgi:hypothetical protein